ncbi:uncharacterized protein TNCV_5051541 [Trichonephila clavipes]|nr:uncharacterized protein TNCV_5051541 [Trichonephila clavipes]
MQVIDVINGIVEILQFCVQVDAAVMNPYTNKISQARIYNEQMKVTLGMGKQAQNIGGCGSPVVKVLDHGRHVMSSRPVPLKTRRVGQRCTLNLSRAETSSRWCGS